MKKYINNRSSILYVEIDPINHKWIYRQMKRLGYPKTRGKGPYLDSLLTALRTKHSADHARKYR